MVTFTVFPSATDGSQFDLAATLNASDERLMLEGKLCRAWTMLDYVERLALKRLVGLSSSNLVTALDEKEHACIFGRAGQGELVDRINSCASKSPKSAEISWITAKIGKSRDGGEIYGRRNQILHGLMQHSPTGQTLLQRVGAANFEHSAPAPTDAEILQLIADIEAAASELDAATKP